MARNAPALASRLRMELELLVSKLLVQALRLLEAGALELIQRAGRYPEKRGGLQRLGQWGHPLIPIGT